MEMEARHVRDQLRFYKKVCPPALSQASIARNARFFSTQDYIEADIKKKEFVLCTLKKQLKKHKEQK